MTFPKCRFRVQTQLPCHRKLIILAMPNPSGSNSQIWAHISNMSSTRGLLHYIEKFHWQNKIFLTHFQGSFPDNDPRNIQDTFSQDYMPHSHRLCPISFVATAIVIRLKKVLKLCFKMVTKRSVVSKTLVSHSFSNFNSFCNLEVAFPQTETGPPKRLIKSLS